VSGSEIAVETLSGAAVSPVIADLARLRVDVFREFPYLYNGDLDYERKYLRKYVDLPESTVVVARSGGAIIGASTALPLLHAEEDIIAPFLRSGIDPAQVYYFGESVLTRAYRGRGLGVKFFEHRELRARTLGFRIASFCAVDRPANHARRPKDYQPLDQFWAKRGYTRRPDLATTFTWQDLDEVVASPKPMTFWIKTL
jgi:GNAT superfamily N-acetyltransferase